MASIGTLSVDLELQLANFIQNAKKAQDTMSGLCESIEKKADIAKEAIVGFGEALAFDWLKEKVEQSLEYAEAIQKLSEATGLSTKNIQEWRYAAGQAGVSGETFDKSIKKFTVSLGQAVNGNQQMAKAMKQLGVTTSDPNQAFLQAATSVQKMGDKSQAAALIQTTMGRGAVEMGAMMREGAQGIEELSKQADELGVVLSQGVINNSVEAEHKLTALKGVITAEWANVIGENAGAITSLAVAFAKLTGELLHFIDAHPELAMAMIGAVAGGIGGGAIGSAPGAGIGMVAGAIGGAIFGHKMRTSRTQAGLPHPDTTVPHLIPLPKGPKDRGPNQQLTFQKELDSETLAGLHMKEQLNSDPQVKAMLGLQAMNYEYSTYDPDSGKLLKEGSKDKEIDDQVNAKKITAAQGEELKLQNKKNGMLQNALVLREEDNALAQQDLQVLTDGIDRQKNLLQTQADYATTASERRTLQLKILDLEYQEKEAVLKAKLAADQRSHASTDVIANDNANIGALAGQKAAQTKAIQNNTMGPLESYLKQIPSSAAEMNEAFQNVAEDGLKSMTDGLVGLIDGTKSVSQAFGDMTKTIIDDIAKILIEQAIAKPLAKSIGSLFGLSFADGGEISGPGSGTSDSILARVSNGEFVVNASATQKNLGLLHAINDNKFADGGLVGGSSSSLSFGPATSAVPANAFSSANDNHKGGINVTFAAPITSNDPAAIEAACWKAIASAAPMLRQQAVDATITKLKRPSL